MPPHRHIVSPNDNHPSRGTLDQGHSDSLAASELGSLAAVSSFVTKGSKQASQPSKDDRPSAVAAQAAAATKGQNPVKRKAGSTSTKGTARNSAGVVNKKARSGGKGNVKSHTRGPPGERKTPSRVKQVSATLMVHVDVSAFVAQSAGCQSGVVAGASTLQQLSR